MYNYCYMFMIYYMLDESLDMYVVTKLTYAAIYVPSYRWMN